MLAWSPMSAATNTKSSKSSVSHATDARDRPMMAMTRARLLCSAQQRPVSRTWALLYLYTLLSGL